MKPKKREIKKANQKIYDDLFLKMYQLDPIVRRDALRNLGSFLSDLDADQKLVVQTHLENKLKDEDSEVREEARIMLMNLGAAHQQTAKRVDTKKKVSAPVDLVQKQEEKEMKEIETQLNSQNLGERFQAAQMIYDSELPRYVPMLEKRLKIEKDEQIIKEIKMALKDLARSEEDRIKELKELLSEYEDERRNDQSDFGSLTRAAVRKIRALVDLKSKKSIPLIKKLVEIEDVRAFSDITTTGLDALSRLHAKESIPFIEKHLDSEDDDIVAAALKALLEMILEKDKSKLKKRLEKLSQRKRISLFVAEQMLSAIKTLEE